MELFHLLVIILNEWERKLEGQNRYLKKKNFLALKITKNTLSIALPLQLTWVRESTKDSFKRQFNHIQKKGQDNKTPRG